MTRGPVIKVPKDLMDEYFHMFNHCRLLFASNSVERRASLMEFRVVKYLGVLTLHMHEPWQSDKFSISNFT